MSVFRTHVNMSSRSSVETHWRSEHYLHSLCHVVLYVAWNHTKIVSWLFLMSLFLWSTVWWSPLILKMSWCPVVTVFNSWPCWLWSHISTPPPSPPLSDFDSLIATVSLSGCSKSGNFAKFMVSGKVHFSRISFGKMSNPPFSVPPSTYPWNFKSFFSRPWNSLSTDIIVSRDEVTVGKL